MPRSCYNNNMSYFESRRRSTLRVEYSNCINLLESLLHTIAFFVLHIRLVDIMKPIMNVSYCYIAYLSRLMYEPYDEQTYDVRTEVVVKSAILRCRQSISWDWPPLQVTCRCYDLKPNQPLHRFIEHFFTWSRLKHVCRIYDYLDWIFNCRKYWISS